ncbi:MAG: hypothetical protein ACT4PU_09735 [Planctomycetota bacterium]
MLRISTLAGGLAWLLLVAAAPAAAQSTGPSADSCESGWVPTFGQSPGVSGYSSTYVAAFASFDDGNGPALYVGGDFRSAGGVAARNVARWDGTAWSALGGGLGTAGDEGGRVNALAVFDDGNGPALYAAGDFTSSAGVAISRIAKWDGTSWTSLGSGITGPTVPFVSTMHVWDDGNGEALYVGGNFGTAGGVPAFNIAKWDGTAWSALGSGTGAGSQKWVVALQPFNDGSGEQLYAGGLFSTMGGAAAAHIARWNGTSWSTVGGGMNDHVWALSVFNDGGGPALHAGGDFTLAGGVPAQRVASWNGSAWSGLGNEIFDSVLSLAVHDDGGGAQLYAGGEFGSPGPGRPWGFVHVWNGTAWEQLASSPGGDVYELHVFDDGDGETLVAGGEFYSAGDVTALHVAGWRAGDWQPLGESEVSGVAALALHDDGSGRKLHVAGAVKVAPTAGVRCVASWDGDAWTVLGETVSGGIGAMQSFDFGTGPRLFVAGNFDDIDGVPAENIAQWDGTSWSALGAGLNAGVNALAIYNDGFGPALYAGGNFSDSGGVPMTRIAKWNGSAWSAVGTGIPSSSVQALAVWNDGGGNALYATGGFTTAGGNPASRIAKWNGSAWSALGSGLNSQGMALAVYNDGGGAALYAGGFFTTVGGLPASHIARWNGTAWSALGAGVSGDDAWVNALAAFNDGDGSQLYVGGSFTIAGGAPASRIARWDGSMWSALGAGLDGAELPAPEGGFDVIPTVTELLPFVTDPEGPALYAGGGAVASLDSLDSSLAKYTGCVAKTWTNLGFALPGVAGEPLLAGTGPLTTGSPGTLTLGGAAPAALSVLFVGLVGAPTHFKCGTLVPVPVAFELPIFTDGAGSIPLAWAAWPSGLSGLSLYFQYAMQDATAVCGVALSNALRADVP